MRPTPHAAPTDLAIGTLAGGCHGSRRGGRDPESLGRLLHPLEVVGGAIERLGSLVSEPRAPLDERRREILELGCHDVVRAIVMADRWHRELAAKGTAVLDQAAAILGADLAVRLRREWGAR